MWPFFQHALFFTVPDNASAVPTEGLFAARSPQFSAFRILLSGIKIENERPLRSTMGQLLPRSAHHDAPEPFTNIAKTCTLPAPQVVPDAGDCI